MFKRLTIGRRLVLGFATVLGVLLLVVVLSFTGMGKTVGNAKEVIYGNQLDRLLAQKEVDHLNWAAQVSTLLTNDSATELTVQTDDHKCALARISHRYAVEGRFGAASGRRRTDRLAREGALLQPGSVGRPV